MKDFLHTFALTLLFTGGGLALISFAVWTPPTMQTFRVWLAFSFYAAIFWHVWMRK